MTTVALICGGLLALMGLTMLARPQLMHTTVTRLDEGRVRYSIALARLLLGCVLLAAAADSRYPELINVLGWVLAVAALVMVTLPLGFWRRFIAFYNRIPTQLLRFTPLMVVVFGCWLAYSFT